MKVAMQPPQAEAPGPLAPAIFLGLQPGAGAIPDFALYNLTAAIPGHPAGSTVSEHTLRSRGYSVPPARTPASIREGG